MTGQHIGLIGLLCSLVLLIPMSYGQGNECKISSVTLRYTPDGFRDLDPVLGSTISLTCSSENVTAYIWQKDGRTIPLEMGNMYMIHNISTADGGVYRCGVEVESCDTRYSNSITLNTPPRIDQLGGPTVVREGETFNLSCSAVGTPSPDILWYFENSQVGKGSVYEVSTARHNQGGQYNCTARNRRGSDSRVHSVTIEALPAPSVTTSTSTMDIPYPSAPQYTSMPTTSPPGGNGIPQLPLVIIIVVCGTLLLLVLILSAVLTFLCCCELCRRWRNKRKASQPDRVHLLSDSGKDDTENGAIEARGTTAVSYANKGFVEAEIENSSSLNSSTPSVHRINGHTSNGKAKRYSFPEQKMDDSSEIKRRRRSKGSDELRSKSEGDLEKKCVAEKKVTEETKTGTAAAAASIVINPGTEETTVELPAESDGDVNLSSSDELVESSDESEDDERMSVLVEKAKKLGRSVSFVKELSRSHPLSLTEISHLVYSQDWGRKHPVFMEYNSVPQNSCSLQLSQAERIKNRYRNVLPNPHSAVKLSDLGTPGSTYINANHIRGFGGKENAYVATQGPIAESIPDFWRMVWEQNSNIVIMITGLIERGVRKCLKYWPSPTDSQPTAYGDIMIRSNFEESTSFYKVSYLTMWNRKENSEERDICHFWCTSWPDFGVPTETSSILTLRDTIDSNRNPNGGPVIVHCSAGLGRSGTFMAIDMGIQQCNKENVVDPLKYMCEMRQDRGGIVQTPEQYLFIHRALADYMTSRQLQQQ